MARSAEEEGGVLSNLDGLLEEDIVVEAGGLILRESLLCVAYCSTCVGSHEGDSGTATEGGD